MKTKIFVAVCLAFCMAMNQLPAQNGHNGNGSVSYYQYDWPVLFVIQVDGQLVDYITGVLTYHLIDHYANGVLVTTHIRWHGYVTGEITGKTYQVSSVELPVDGTLTYWEGILPGTTDWVSFWVMDPLGYCMDHLICEDGSVYIIRYNWSLIDALNGGAGMTNYECRVAGRK